jgi:hypothetical protein
MDVVYLKLVSGEDIICYVENSDEEYLYVYKPIRFQIKNTPRGSVVRSSKWIPLVEESEFPIKRRDVMIIATPTKDMDAYYHETLDVLDDMSLENDFQHEKRRKTEEEEIEALYELHSNTNIKVH